MGHRRKRERKIACDTWERREREKLSQHAERERQKLVASQLAS